MKQSTKRQYHIRECMNAAMKRWHRTIKKDGKKKVCERMHAAMQEVA